MASGRDALAFDGGISAIASSRDALNGGISAMASNPGVRRNSASSRRFLTSAARVRFARTRSSFFFFLTFRSEMRRSASRAASPAKAQSLRRALSRRRRASEAGRTRAPLPPYAASTRTSRVCGGNVACARRPDEAAPDAGGGALPLATRSRYAASAYARSTRAVSTAKSASRSVPSSPTRNAACRRSRRSTAATRPCAPASASTTRRVSVEPPF